MVDLLKFPFNKKILSGVVTINYKFVAFFLVAYCGINSSNCITHEVGWICADLVVIRFVVAGLCLHFEVFECHQTLENFFTKNVLHVVKYFWGVW